MKKIISLIFVLSTFYLTYSMEDKRDLVKDSPQTENQITYTLECPICMEMYGEEHEPVVLKCTHFLCLKCAETMINQPCPFCKQPVSITGVSLQIHLTNTYNPDEDKETSCSICKENFTRGEDVDRNACSQHIFHDACINRLIQGYFEKSNEAECPMCKKSIVLNLFFQAVKTGDCQLVANFLELGIDINAKNEDMGYKSALMIASERGDQELVALLIKNDAGVQEAKLLIEQGANIEVQDKYDFTSLLGRTEIVKLLIESGANINSQDEDGRTVLMWAADQGHKETVKLLLEDRVKIEVQSNEGFTALMRAVKNGHTEIVKLLIDNGAKIEAETKSGNTALTIAARDGHTAIVQVLIENGANINVHTNGGFTPLILAAKKGHTEIVKLLIESGAKY